MKQEALSPPAKPPLGVIVEFQLIDSCESFHVAAREGISTVFPGHSDAADATVRLPERIWMALVLGLTSLGDALLADGVEAEGDVATFVRFHRRFATEVPASGSRALQGGR